MSATMKATRWVSMGEGNRVVTTPVISPFSEAIKMAHTSDEARPCPMMNDERVAKLIERSAVGGVTVWAAHESALERRFGSLAQSSDDITKDTSGCAEAVQYSGRDDHGYVWRVVLFKMNK